ncbi:MAG: SIMPL domain-containing protein [Cyanobacteriota bacterium]|nr:SIMPL domain-containing protein [Cyanobacteriota bacterium]
MNVKALWREGSARYFADATATLARIQKPMAIAIASIAILSLPMSVEAQERMSRTLTVTGQGETTIPTTITRVQLGVEVRGETAAEVQQEVRERSAAVVDLLRSRNVAQLQTTGITLRPNYTRRNDEQRLIGYIGINSVSFRVGTERAGSLIDEAIEVGATRIDNVGFIAEDSAIAAASKDALRDASQDAQEQADVVLEALNLSRQEIISIQINGSNTSPPAVLQNAMLSAESYGTPVMGGDRVVRASVTLEIRY